MRWEVECWFRWPLASRKGPPGKRGIGSRRDRLPAPGGSEWQKSSYSASNNECVEVRAGTEAVELRESDEPGAILRAAPAVFADLLNSIKAGRLDRHLA
ncbi:DUF397 domain-containing protein [Kitasatospora sp. NPDC015120]|uniref:DUF397 domain-containing protein n=1 Tax=Kitasatospora sp. NPDC015120 TaxID=3364023 RepID=UPI0036F492C5